jgi:hypothetical protein
MFKKFGILFAFLMVLVIAAGGYAFAAANTGVTATKAGFGQAAISGYAVSNIAYTLNADPTKLDKVTFTLDAAATTVKVQLDKTTPGTWYSCSNGGTGNDWTCATTSPQQTVALMDELSIVASDTVAP